MRSRIALHELLVGARDRQRIDVLERGLLEPFRTRRRIHVPTLATWSLLRRLPQPRGRTEIGGLAIRVQRLRREGGAQEKALSKADASC